MTRTFSVLRALLALVVVSLAAAAKRAGNVDYEFVGGRAADFIVVE